MAKKWARWTAEEDAALLRMAVGGVLDVGVAASEVGRSRLSVSGRAKALRLWVKNRRATDNKNDRVYGRVPGQMLFRKTTYEERVESVKRVVAERTERRGDCLIWTGAVMGSGHAMIRLTLEDGSCSTAGHRSVWIAWRGPVPKGMYVLHKRECTSSSCLNIDHLYLGTAQQNMDDRTAVGRPLTKIKSRYPAGMGDMIVGAVDAGFNYAQIGRMLEIPYDDARRLGKRARAA